MHGALLYTNVSTNLVVFEAIPSSCWHNIRLPHAREAIEFVIHRCEKCYRMLIERLIRNILLCIVIGRLIHVQTILRDVVFCG